MEVSCIFMEVSWGYSFGIIGFVTAIKTWLNVFSGLYGFRSPPGTHPLVLKHGKLENPYLV